MAKFYLDASINSYALRMNSDPIPYAKNKRNVFCTHESSAYGVLYINYKKALEQNIAINEISFSKMHGVYANFGGYGNIGSIGNFDLNQSNLFYIQSLQPRKNDPELPICIDKITGQHLHKMVISDKKIQIGMIDAPQLKEFFITAEEVSFNPKGTNVAICDVDQYRLMALKQKTGTQIFAASLSEKDNFKREEIDSTTLNKFKLNPGIILGEYDDPEGRIKDFVAQINQLKM